MRLMIKILIVVSIFTLINPVVIGDNIKEYNNLNGRSTQEGKIIYWNLTTNGTIYSPEYSGGRLIDVGSAYGNGTIRLFWEYYIEPKDTLIIEPGVEIIIYGPYIFDVEFHVYGTLITVGDKDKRIEFRSTDKNQNWGFYLYNDVNTIKSKIEYCNITNGRIHCKSSSPIISNNIIVNYRCGAISCRENSNPIIANNTISTPYLMGYSIWCVNSHPIIENNIIDNKIGEFGRWSTAILLEKSNAIIKNNVIRNCEEGININGNSNPIIDNNTFIKIFNYFYDKEMVIGNDLDNPNTINAEYNYWGTIDEKEIRKKIEGKVDYEPWIDENGNVYYSTGKTDDNNDDNFEISFQFGLFIIIIIIAIVTAIVWWQRKKRKKSK